MKRINFVLIVALVSLILPLSAHAAGTPSPVPQLAPHFDGLPGRLIVARLNVRRAPRLTSSIVGKLTQDTPFLLIGRTLGAVWVQVKGDFGIGWADRSFIRFDGMVRDIPVTEVIPPFLTINGQPFVHVRAGPSEIYPIVADILPGVEIDVIATHRRASWFQVAMPDDGPTGWVRSDMVIVDGPIRQLPDLPALPIIAQVVSYRVNVRSEPRLDAPVIGVALYKRFYTVVGLDARRNFWQIEGSFGKGWILSEFVQVFGDVEDSGLPEIQTKPLRG
jgi:uncharacterized protein YgiM (DUF1202 family)